MPFGDIVTWMKLFYKKYHNAEREVKIVALGAARNVHKMPHAVSNIIRKIRFLTNRVTYPINSSNVAMNLRCGLRSSL